MPDPEPLWFHILTIYPPAIALVVFFYWSIAAMFQVGQV